MSMDMLLKADNQRFVSPPVVFKDFLVVATHRAEVSEKLALSGVKEKMRRMQEVDPDALRNFEEVLDVTDLHEVAYNTEMDGGLDRNQIVSQHWLLDESSRRRNAQYKSIALRALRYDHIDMKTIARKSPFLLDNNLKSELESDDAPPPVYIPLKYSDLIVSVSVYLGYTRELEYHEIRLGRLLKVTDRFELTGEHTVEDLKNAFSCPADFAFTEDFSEKTPTVEDLTKNKFPSNMFFLHDTFYVDQNLPEDPSEIARKWAEKRGTFGPIRSLPMTTKLADMTARLGQPYVFIHQGVCEHLIVFNELCHRDETHEGVEFPRRIVERNFRRIACDCCKEESAKWMILEHENLMVNSPGHLCGSCFEEFCFDVNGKKVTKFKAVPYCDRKEIGDGGKFLTDLRFQKK